MTPVNEREIGEIISKIEQLRHDRRNDRQALTFLDDEVKDLQRQLVQLRTRVHTGLYVASAMTVTVATVIAWLVQVLS